VKVWINQDFVLFRATGNSIFDLLITLGQLRIITPTGNGQIHYAVVRQCLYPKFDIVFIISCANWPLEPHARLQGDGSERRYARHSDRRIRFSARKYVQPPNWWISRQ
jgi:hypothetical protein